MGISMNVYAGYLLLGRQRNVGPSQCCEHDIKAPGNNPWDDGSPEFSIGETCD